MAFNRVQGASIQWRFLDIVCNELCPPLYFNTYFFSVPHYTTAAHKCHVKNFFLYHPYDIYNSSGRIIIILSGRYIIRPGDILIRPDELLYRPYNIKKNLHKALTSRRTIHPRSCVHARCLSQVSRLHVGKAKCDYTSLKSTGFSCNQ